MSGRVAVKQRKISVSGPRHFLNLSDLDSATLRGIIAEARRRKNARAGLPRGMADRDAPLKGHMLAMIFDRPSTRTRISFDVGMQQLGGQSINLAGADTQLGRGETIADTARVLSRYVDAIMLRTLAHESLQGLAENSGVPVINGLTKSSHPCQVMADVMTFEETKGSIRGRTIAWSGDCNNVCASWIHAAARFGFALRIATPEELAPSSSLRKWAREAGTEIEFTSDPQRAVSGADCVVTDTWISMGDRDASRRRGLLRPYRVDDALMARAKPDAIFMHCLPAHRGEEVTNSVIDGPQSVVYDEAENRLHVQKAILLWCLE
jgi:ornithine carbamoyltransferase